MTVDRAVGYTARGWVGGRLMAAAGDAFLRGAWWPLVLWLVVAVLLAGWIVADLRRDRGRGWLK